MRISVLVCLALAVVLVVLGMNSWMEYPIGLYIAAGLFALLGLWLFVQPKRDDRGPDERPQDHA